MGYEVRLRRKAEKGLETIPDRYFEAVSTAVSALETNPRPQKTKKLADSGLWRVRVGHYRIIYAIDDEARLVTVVRVSRRREDTYRGLR